MPFPIAAAIAAGSSLAGQYYNAQSTGKLNKKTMRWNEQMYERQRKDALTDVAFQNEYNSPAAQMQRLKSAGLNPHLVYGNGATTEGATVRSSSVEGWRPSAPQVDTTGATSALFQAYDLDMKQTQIDMLKESMNVARQDAILKAAQTASTLQGTETGKFNLGMLKNLEMLTMEAAKANLKKTYADIDSTTAGTELSKLHQGKVKADTQFTLDQNQRAAMMNSANLQTAWANILKIQAETKASEGQWQQMQHAIQNMEKEGLIKDLDIALKRTGAQPGDAAWQRTIQQILQSTPGWDKEGDLKKLHDLRIIIKDMIRNLTGLGRE